MKTLDPKLEKKVLQDMVEQLKNPEQTMQKQKKMKKIIYATGYTGVLIAFLLGLNDVTHDFIPTFIAAVFGCAVGYALLLTSLQEQWPITVDHIDLDSVKARLEELENP